MSVIVVFGKKRHGKDFLSLLICSILNDYPKDVTLERVLELQEQSRESLNKSSLYCELYAFADPIKDFVANWAHSDVDTLNDPAVREVYNPELKMSPRQAWQKVGQAMKDIDQDIWFNLLMQKLRYAGTDTVVVTDGRFKNEYTKCREKRFILVNIFDNDVEDNDSDISENDLNDIYKDREAHFDYVFDNTGKDFERLKESVINMLEDLEIEF